MQTENLIFSPLNPELGNAVNPFLTRVKSS